MTPMRDQWKLPRSKLHKLTKNDLGLILVLGSEQFPNIGKLHIASAFKPCLASRLAATSTEGDLPDRLTVHLDPQCPHSIAHSCADQA